MADPFEISPEDKAILDKLARDNSGPFGFKPPRWPQRDQNITKTLDAYDKWKNTPPDQGRHDAYLDYMMTIPSHRPSYAQNSGAIGPNPSYPGLVGQQDTPSGVDTRDGHGLRSLRKIMDLGRDVPYTPGPRESSNVIDTRDPFQGLLHNLQTVFGRRD